MIYREEKTNTINNIKTQEIYFNLIFFSSFSIYSFFFFQTIIFSFFYYFHSNKKNYIKLTLSHKENILNKKDSDQKDNIKDEDDSSNYYQNSSNNFCFLVLSFFLRNIMNFPQNFFKNILIFKFSKITENYYHYYIYQNFIYYYFSVINENLSLLRIIKLKIIENNVIILKNERI